jgi:hypothetical protein
MTQDTMTHSLPDLFATPCCISDRSARRKLLSERLGTVLDLEIGHGLQARHRRDELSFLPLYPSNNDTRVFHQKHFPLGYGLHLQSDGT